MADSGTGIYHVEGDANYSTYGAAKAAAGAGDTLTVHRKDTDGVLWYIEDFDTTTGFTVNGDDGIVFGLNAISTMSNASGTLTFENIMFHPIGGSSINKYVQPSGNGERIFSRCWFFKADNVNGFAIQQSSGSGNMRMYQCMSFGGVVFGGSGTGNRCYNSVVYNHNAYTLGIFANQTCTLDAYNNIIMMASTAHAALSKAAGATLNEDYNSGKGTGFSGGNDTSGKTIATAGLVLGSAITSVPNAMDLRVLSSDQEDGTTTPNGVDLTTLYTSDIEERARPATAAGYARGATYGYDPTGGGGGGGLLSHNGMNGGLNA